MTLRISCDSCTPSAAVGSSRIRIRRAWCMPRAIATAWRWPPERSSTFAVVSRTFICRRPASISAASRCMRALATMPKRVGSLPRKRFSAMLRQPTRARFWYTVEMPARNASSGAENETGSPSTKSAPSLGSIAPEKILTSVDFPAPLSPTIACVSPLSSEKSTPRRASTWP